VSDIADVHWRGGEIIEFVCLISGCGHWRSGGELDIGRWACGRGGCGWGLGASFEIGVTVVEMGELMELVLGSVYKGKRGWRERPRHRVM